MFKSLTFVFSLFFSVSLYAFSEDISEAEQSLMHQVGQNRELRDEVALYRREVERTASHFTMRLCRAYREVNGLSNQHISNESVVDHGSSISKTHDSGGSAHNYTLEDSFAAWAELAYIGSKAAALSWFGSGQNVKYNLLDRTSFWDLDHWLRQSHLILYLNSWGFLSGAVHCLNSTSAKDIKKFASWIIVAESLGATGGHVGVLYTGEAITAKLFPLIKSTLSWTLRPLKKALSLLKIRPRRGSLLLFGIPTGIVVGDNLFCHLSKKEEMMEKSQLLINELMEDIKSSDSSMLENYNTMLNIYRTFLISHKVCEEVDSDANQESVCRQAQQNFISYFHESNKEISDFESDLEELKRRKSLSDSSRRPYCTFENGEAESSRELSSSEIYAELLEFMIPILKSI